MFTIKFPCTGRGNRESVQDVAYDVNSQFGLDAEITDEVWDDDGGVWEVEITIRHHDREAVVDALESVGVGDADDMVRP